MYTSFYAMARRFRPCSTLQCTQSDHAVATFTRLKSESWRVQVRRKGKYVNNTFLRRKDAEEWALQTEQRVERLPGGEDIRRSRPR